MQNRKAVVPHNALEDARILATWSTLLVLRSILPLAVLLAGNLLHSMNLLITATLLPSIVTDIGGSYLMSRPTTAFVARRSLPHPELRPSARRSETGGRFVAVPLSTQQARCCALWHHLLR
jgi:hypothetical protein